MPPIDGLDRIEGAWTNRDATTADRIPERLLVVGGGAAGVAMAQAFGSQVTLIVADFLHAATIAIVGELPLERLRHAVPPFPTRSEVWLGLLDQAAV